MNLARKSKLSKIMSKVSKGKKLTKKEAEYLARVRKRRR